MTNGDAESVPKATSGVTNMPGWTSSGPVTILAYGGSFPSLTSPGPTVRGNNFFYGGVANFSAASQSIDLSFAATDIDTGKVAYDLSAWIGGYSSQNDTASVIVSFLDASGKAVGSETPAVGPVSPADRGNVTGLFPRAQLGTVPAGARSASVVMSFIRATTSGDLDGYLDNVSLVLSLAPASTVACPSILNADLSLDVDNFAVFADALTARLQLSQSANGGWVASISNLGITAKSNCDPVDIGVVVSGAGGYVLHVPSIMVGASRYWANFDVIFGTNGVPQLRLAGLGQGIKDVAGASSAYQSLVKVDQFTSTGNAFSYRQIFPDNSEHKVNITLLPDQSYTPSANESTVIGQLGARAYGMKTTYSSPVGGSSYQLSTQFFVPYSSLSAATVQQIRNGGQAGGSASAPVRGTFAADSGVMVGLKSIGMNTGKEAVLKMIEKGLAKAAAWKYPIIAGDGADAVGNVGGKAVGIAKDAYDAWQAHKDLEAWNHRVNLAERCLNANITDPTVKQQMSSAIGAARGEISSNGFVNYFAMGASTLLGFVEAGAVPLFLATGAMTDLVGDAVKETNESRTKEIETAAGRCDIRWLHTFEGSGTDVAEDSHDIGPDFTTKRTYRAQMDYIWKIAKVKLVFKDNTRGLLSPTYGKNHVEDYQFNNRSITGTYYSLETEDSPDYHFREECRGFVYDAAWEGGSVEVTDNLNLEGKPYPPTPEFQTKIPGFTDVLWRGACVTDGVTANASGSWTLGVPVRDRFDMPADFRSSPVEHSASGSVDSGLFSNPSKSSNWTGEVKLLPY